MYKYWLSAAAGILAFAAMLSLAQAQIVIPDINRDTIKNVPPPPPAFTGQNRDSTSTESKSVPQKRNPLCDRLSPAMQHNTPGCQ